MESTVVNLLVSKVPRTLIERFGAPTYRKSLGLLVTPSVGAAQVDAVNALGARWAADNEAYSAFDERAYMRMLSEIAGKFGCLFVTAPDVVGNARYTLISFLRWHKIIRAYRLPVGYVAQNGQENLFTPWDAFDCLFIGGDTAWKLGAAAAGLAVEAKRRNKHVHIGRVNSNRRINWVEDFHLADTMDGTGYAKFSNSMIPRALKKLEQPRLITARHYPKEIAA
jgi:hypothetical protein